MWLYFTFFSSLVELGGLSNAKIAEHYADCIKLSSENVSDLFQFARYVLAGNVIVGGQTVQDARIRRHVHFIKLHPMQCLALYLHITHII